MTHISTNSSGIAAGQSRHIGIAGAGLLGRLAAWQLAVQGHVVHVFDPAPGPGPSFADAHGDDTGLSPAWLSQRAACAAPSAAWPQAAGFTAAGMLSPIAELDNAEPALAAMGWRAVVLWRAVVRALGEGSGSFAPYFGHRGSIMLAHRSDLGSAQRVLARLRAAQDDPVWQSAVTLAGQRFAAEDSAQAALLTDGASSAVGEPCIGQPQSIALPQLQALEPSLANAAHAWFLPGEGQIDTVNTLLSLYLAAQATGRVSWHWGERVEAVAPGRLRLQGSAGSAARDQGFDQVLDVRGLGARPDLPTRGVRGELVWLHAPGHGLTRPVRLLHPRHRVYIVPRPGDLLLVGASEIESEDRSPVSLRSAVELMAAAHSVLPAAAEARVVRMDVNLRPALPDNGPRIEVQAGLIRINGLFRHGWLLAPALLQQALHRAGLGDALAGVGIAEVGGAMPQAAWFAPFVP